MCAATYDTSSPIGFESVSFAAQLCGEARWFGDNVLYSSDLVFVECLVLDLLLLLTCVPRNNAAMLRRCQLENQ